MKSRRAKPHSNKSSRHLAVVACAAAISFGGGAARSAEAAEETILTPAKAGEKLDPGLKTEIDGYAQLAKDAIDQEKWPLADHFLELLASVPCDDAEKKSAFRELAAAYEKHHQTAKAVGIYEKAIEMFARDPELPDFLFKAGMLYRETGAYGRAVSRFYSVLNTSLKINERGVGAYRDLSQKAQQEIAETYFLQGDYKQASKFFQLLARTDLPAEQKGHVQFKAMQCQFLLEDSAGAVVSGGKFLSDFPDDEAVPECRYVLASALRSLGRKKESFDAVLALLREEKARREKAPERWAYWQKKTGNEFANEYYRQGDFLSALTIYQTLAKLGDEPEWQWPVVYQIGLCFERLRLVSRAGEAFKYIIEQSKKAEPGAPPLPENLTNLVQMAQWRGEQLAWHHAADTRLQHLLGEPQDVPVRASAEPPKTAAAQP